MNQLILQAQVLEMAPIRYTPAGLPALDLTLRSDTQVEEAGSPRKVVLDLKAVAIGEITRDLQALELGREVFFKGFLTAQRQGRGVVFHITRFKL